ncbi:MAG: nuclear transport factor 2 family protein [Caldilineaceae bacterium]|nr:nuclear transport factor 2 family protein [Caldilineaceae bacterium]
MTHENGNQVQVVQELYAAFGRADMPTILNLLDEEVDWHFVGKPQDVPFAGPRHGHAQMIDFFVTVDETCDVLEFGPHEVIPLGEHVLALGREQARVKATGRIFETDWAHLFTVRRGKIVRLREFYDTATMSRAFQL